MSEIFTALRAGGALPGGGFGGRNRLPVAESGNYLVRLTANGRTLEQVLRVERVSGGDGTTVADSEDDLDP